MSRVMGIAYNPFLFSEAGNAYMNFEMAELLKIWTENIIEIDPTERERPSLDLLLEKMADMISMLCSKNRMELKMGNINQLLITSLGTLRADSERMLCEHHCEHSDGIGVILEDVQLAITGDARVRAFFGNGVERRVMSWSVTKGPETHQRLEDCS